MVDSNRRDFLKITGLGLIALPLLAACGPGGGGGSQGGIRFAWWGGADRQTSYRKAIDAFVAANAGARILPEFADYDAFQERMTTQIAARDVAEVFWIPSPQVMTYADAGLYRRLDDIPSFDLSDYSDVEIDSYRLGGELNTFPKSVFSSCVRYNKTFLDEAGASLPDDWTWDSLSEFLIDYTNDAPDGRRGTSYNAQQDMAFESWLRQRGSDLWTEGGELGASVDDFASWFDWWERLRLAGATPSISEQEGAAPEWPIVGASTLLTFGNTNHIIDEAPQFPDSQFEMVQVPVVDGAADGHPFLFLSRIAVYSGTSDSDLEAAGAFLNYNVNSQEMFDYVGLSAGAPPNPRLLEGARATASEDGVKVLDITSAIQEADRRPRFEAPPGTGSWRDLMVRAVEEITLGGSSVRAAAETVVENISSQVRAPR